MGPQVYRYAWMGYVAPGLQNRKGGLALEICVPADIVPGTRPLYSIQIENPLSESQTQ